jgi:putative two-component system response regulator
VHLPCHYMSREFDVLRILIVDDEPSNLRVLEHVLRRQGYHQIETATSAPGALKLAARNPPDIVLLDLHLRGWNGIEVIHALRTLNPTMYPLVVVVTGDTSSRARAEVLAAGAKDFITKPFDNTEIALRIRNLVELRLMHKRLQRSNALLEAKLLERTAEAEEARLEVLERLAMAAEYRDDATGQHIRRVGTLAGWLARAVGLSSDEAERIARAAPLHDVGKIAIPDQILLKPGRLNDTELDVMRTHTTIGAKLLSKSRSPLMNTARDVALYHHERWDGRGYPNRVGSSDIPIAGRIVGLVDFFDALSHDRPYRRRNDLHDTLQLIGDERGKHFDPRVTDAFLDWAGTLYEELSA